MHVDVDRSNGLKMKKVNLLFRKKTEETIDRFSPTPVVKKAKVKTGRQCN